MAYTVAKPLLVGAVDYPAGAKLGMDYLLGEGVSAAQVERLVVLGNLVVDTPSGTSKPAAKQKAKPTPAA